MNWAILVGVTFCNAQAWGPVVVLNGEPEK